MQITTFLLIALASSGLAEPLPFTKLREGKCTAPGGDCRLKREPMLPEGALLDQLPRFMHLGWKHHTLTDGCWKWMNGLEWK
ncbi:uncharacterized protein PG998_012189 [Apiospora kogelbergensis]|uniref:uncharacterized protein n=1 Tax=Apiospora kogelbergensis TaxID=1337665 RepID=UPI0031322847